MERKTKTILVVYIDLCDYQAPASPKCFTSRTTLVTVVTCWVVCCLCVRATSAAAATAAGFDGIVESDGTSLCTDKCDEFGECSNVVAWPLLQIVTVWFFELSFFFVWVESILFFFCLNENSSDFFFKSKLNTIRKLVIYVYKSTRRESCWWFILVHSFWVSVCFVLYVIAIMIVYDVFLNGLCLIIIIAIIMVCVCVCGDDVWGTHGGTKVGKWINKNKTFSSVYFCIPCLYI